jgi:hypothetical protein
MTKSMGYRWIQVFSQGILVAESTFIVRSDEWLLIKPAYGTGSHMIGDTIVFQENTDVDSISITFGGGIQSY